jgi:hypothetical protein
VGQEIFYCWKCKSLVRSRDLEKGKAVREGDQVACEECAGDSKAALPTTTPKPVPAVDPVLLSGETPRSRMVAAVPGKTPRRGTAAAKGGSGAGIYIGVGIGAVILLVVIAAAASGGKPQRPPAAAPPSEGVRAEPPPAPVPQPVRADPEPRPRPAPVQREADPKKAVEEARAFVAENPKDFSGQVARATRAALQASGSAVQAEAEELLSQVKKAAADAVTSDLKALDERAREPLGKGEFAEALKVLEPARSTHGLSDWTQGLDARIKSAREAAAKAAGEAVAKILDARRRGAVEEAKSLAARPERFGMAEAKAEIEKAMAQPVEVLPSKEALAYRKRWDEAAALLAPRDYAAAIKALEAGPAPAEEAVKAEAAAVLEGLRLAADVSREAHAALAKWLRGQPIRLILNDGALVEGKFLRHAGAELELLGEEDVVRVLVGEIAPSLLSELYGLRVAKNPKTDALAAAAFHALEGDLEGAKKHAAAVPEKLLAAGRKAAEARADAKEVAARKLFGEAEAEFRRPVTRGSAAEKYRALLAEHGGTAFVGRARAVVEARAEAAKDAFYWADELAGAGTFARSESAKVDSCWSSLAESAPGKAPSNYVEFRFHALPEGQTRAWVLAGGCCQETFAFGLQADELTMPNPKDPKELVACDPGGAHWTPVRNAMSLRRFHVQHGGPKEPARWAWIPLPLPKYASAGSKKARLLTEQQGFSVAYVLVSSGRSAPLRDGELKDIEKARAAHREMLGAGREVQTGSILREYWTGMAGSKIPDLTKHPLYPDKPSGSNLMTSLEIPAEWADNYGTRIRGYVHPPATGAYTFWISSDDDGELYLSTDESPLRKTRIAWLEGASAARQFDQQANQKSAPIQLVAGRRYYLEVLHKEGNVNDHLCVGWQVPGGALERPIPGNRLSPWGATGKSGGKATFYRAVNLNGPAVVIDGHAWEGKDAPNLSAAGKGFENQDVPLAPAVEGAKAQMIRSSAFERGGSAATLSAVPAGTYQVYLYVWEDSSAQVFDILLEGKPVAQGYNSGPPGHWDRLGPWTVDVSDGTIELKTSGGDANLSGIEVWRVK